MGMDMLSGEEITAAGLTDWRKLGQGLHARFAVGDLSAAARFVTAISQAGPAVSDHLDVRIGTGFVDLRLISDEAIYRDDEGVEHRVEWVTAYDVDAARQISRIAREQGLPADPGAVTEIEVALDTANAVTIAPVWAALLTGGPQAQGRGSIGDDIRDVTRRIPILWFQDTDPHPTPRQRFHLDIQVPYEVATARIAAAVAAGATVVDDSQAPGTTVLADPDGNKVCVGTSQPPPATTGQEALSEQVSGSAG